jgi:hypothetical protein
VLEREEKKDNKNTVLVQYVLKNGTGFKPGLKTSLKKKKKRKTKTAYRSELRKPHSGVIKDKKDKSETFSLLKINLSSTTQKTRILF